MELAQDEFQNLAKTWILVIISVSYCYFIGKITQKGIPRFFIFIPIIFLFIVLPLNLTSIHLLGITSFFISWLATFKLLLFASGRGPLVVSVRDHTPISLPLFVAVACLPIKIRHESRNSEHDPVRDTRKHDDPDRRIYKKGMLNFAAKAAMLLFMIRVNDVHNDRLHPKLVWLIYSFHIYFMLELILAAVAAAAASVFHEVELEPQFDEPLLSTSLQDFWGRRWNLMVTSILRPTVYEPTLVLARRRVGKEAARVVAVFMTFVVSGAMHELVFYHMGRVTPTFEVTWFFVLHGVCLCMEMGVKRVVDGRWRVHRPVSGPVTAVFVLVTGFWLFLPPLLRCGADVRAFEEYALVGAFLGRVGQSLVPVGRQFR